MKYILCLFIVLVGFVANAQTTKDTIDRKKLGWPVAIKESYYPISLGQSQVFTISRQISEVQRYLGSTNMPLQEYKAIVGRLDSVWMTIYSQLPDSIKTKK